MTAGVRPRIGFVGLGWIARLRLEALVGGRQAGDMGDEGGPGAPDAVEPPAEVVAFCEPDPERLAEVGAEWPDAWRCTSLEELLQDGPELDGVVISTPNALHCRQALLVLERDIAPFVQKPLGIRPGEVADVLEVAERRDLPLGVDLTYRGLEGARQLRSMIAGGRLGEVFLVEGAFHNAYGPDKAWCFDPALSGGGALLDLGVHLVDLAFWCCGARGCTEVEGWRRDVPDHPGIDGFAEVEGVMRDGPRFRVGASWNAHAGRDCDVRLTFHGTDAGAEIRNVDGSFYDFELVLRKGRTEERVVLDRRRWMDRPLLEWVGELNRGAGFDPAIRSNLTVARLLGRVYDRDASVPERGRAFAGAASEGRAAASASSSPTR